LTLTPNYEDYANISARHLFSFLLFNPKPQANFPRFKKKSTPAHTVLQPLHEKDEVDFFTIRANLAALVENRKLPAC